MQSPLFFLPLFLLLGLLGACSQDEGIGGKALITGKVFVQDYNSSGFLRAEFYAPDEDVFIVYGDNPVYNDAMKTHYDGTYRFEYLHKGHYTIYAYSDCDTCASKVRPVLIETDITENNQVIILPDLALRK